MECKMEKNLCLNVLQIKNLYLYLQLNIENVLQFTNKFIFQSVL